MPDSVYRVVQDAHLIWLKLQCAGVSHENRDAQCGAPFERLDQSIDPSAVVESPIRQRSPRTAMMHPFGIFLSPTPQNMHNQPV